MTDTRPLAVDLFCGLGGWTEGLQAAGYRVVGFDNERHVYGDAKYPAQLVLQDVLTIHGAQFKTAALIVASPPCQEFSYMAMPWTKAKEKAAKLLDGRDDPKRLTALFDACFRIQREACEAAGHYVPLVVENVCGAQRWVGRARWHYGSFYLWGDVPALMPIVVKHQKVAGFRFDGSGGSFQSASVKVAGLNWSNHGKPGYKAEAFNGTAEQRLKATKNETGGSWFPQGNGASVVGNHGRDRLVGVKGSDGYERDHPEAFGWKKPRTSSHSKDRKHASAQIAKIPFPLALHIGQAWKPSDVHD